MHEALRGRTKGAFMRNNKAEWARIGTGTVMVFSATVNIKIQVMTGNTGNEGVPSAGTTKRKETLCRYLKLSVGFRAEKHVITSQRSGTRPWQAGR